MDLDKDTLNDFKLLNGEQIYGSEKIDFFNKYTSKCAITDFAILLGGCVSSENFIPDDSSLKGRTGWYYLLTPDKGNLRAVSLAGKYEYSSAGKRSGGVRPILYYSNISNLSLIELESEGDFLEVEYGEYPQYAVDSSLAKKLEEKFLAGKLKKTGKVYTTDSRRWDKNELSFLAKEHEEFEYKGKRYVRVISNCCESDFMLSNWEAVSSGDVVWVEVSPIKWYVDEKSNILISKNIIVSGLRFCNNGEYKGDFSNTEMKRFFDNFFSKEIIVKRNYLQDDKRTRLEKLNPDETKIEDRRDMTDTEIIHSWIESGQSVLLRGPSGIGKTERIKSLYPNLIYIKLTNNMFPEKVVGSMNLQTGQNIPPDFAKQALLECATEEEKKLVKENVQNLYDLADEIYERSKSSEGKVVILLDELLNVKPAVQSLVYTLVLNRLVETGKGLKLPANTVIVATGNQKKYSSVAEDLAEPLEKRFDHILDMEPKVGEWINEYAIPNKIHPTVVGYILSKYLLNRKSEEISDIGYFYEEPEVGEKKLDQNGCKGRTNDPRGWVSISNMLYAFEENLKNKKYIGKNVAKLLKVSIGSKLREEWASEFFDFYNIPTVSVDEVMNDSYKEEELPQDINERFACVMSLLIADENQVGKCRKFIREHCDPEYLQLYDICWAGKDESRILKINELQELDIINIESDGIKL